MAPLSPARTDTPDAPMLQLLRDAGAATAAKNPARPGRLFIHGFTGAPASWDAVCAHLDDDRVHMAMRLVGHHPETPLRAVIAQASSDAPGTPADPHAPQAFEQVVHAMCEAVAKLPKRPWHVIGYSLGARLGLGMLLRAPALFSQATLVGGHPGLQNEAARLERARGDAAWEQLLRDGGVAAFMRRWLEQPLFARLADLPTDVLARDQRLREGHDAQALADAFAATSLARMPSHWPQLAHIQVPVCFVAGAEDEKFQALLRAAHQSTPNSVHQTVPGAGHNVLLEAPRPLARLIAALEKRV